MKKIILSTLLFIMTAVQGQISKNFGKEIKALVEAESPDLMVNEIKSENASTFYRTDLTLEGFEVNYIVSAIIGNVLYAKYLHKGDDAVMDSIYIRLNTTSYLIYDSKYSPDEVNVENSILRKIVVKSNITGKTVLKVILTKSNEINLQFVRI